MGSHWLIPLIKWLLFAGFIYQTVQDAIQLHNRPVQEFYYWNYRSFYELAAVLGGAVGAFFISIELAHGGVIASAIVGLTAAVVFPSYGAAIYCGSFVGMASTSVFNSYPNLLLAAAIAAVIYVAARPACQGFGGKLGTIAFAGTLISLLLTQGQLSSAPLPENSFGIVLVLFSMTGAWLTYLINVTLKHGPVIASALVGMIAGLVLPALFGPEEGKTLALMVFASSFAGMSSAERIRSPLYIIVAGGLAALLFIYTQPIAGGAGGKMGTIAFGAVIAVGGLEEGIAKLHK